MLTSRIDPQLIDRPEPETSVTGRADIRTPQRPRLAGWREPPPPFLGRAVHADMAPLARLGIPPLLAASPASAADSPGRPVLSEPRPRRGAALAAALLLHGAALVLALTVALRIPPEPPVTVPIPLVFEPPAPAPAAPGASPAAEAPQPATVVPPAPPVAAEPPPPSPPVPPLPQAPASEAPPGEAIPSEPPPSPAPPSAVIEAPPPPAPAPAPVPIAPPQAAELPPPVAAREPPAPARPAGPLRAEPSPRRHESRDTARPASPRHVEPREHSRAEESPAPAHSAPPTASPAAPAAPAAPLVPPRPVAGLAGNRRPSYPGQARDRGEQGTVVVRVQVTAEGAAAAVSVAHSSGHPALDEAAVAAIRSWRFSPATRGGVPVAAEADVPVAFHLDD